jgi:membrane protein YdbS with pleckstrin-like domain
MKRRSKDFIEISLFTFVISTALLLLLQTIINIVYYLLSSDVLEVEFNLKLLLSFEIILLFLSSLLGLIYVFLFFEYKNTQMEEK